MKNLIIFFLAIALNSFSFAQCSTVSISVSSSDTSTIQLYHAGFFNIPSGFANVCVWEVSTFDGEIVFQDTTSGAAFEQGQVLFDHTVSIADSMNATVVITNVDEGLICTLADTLFWEETEVIPGSFIGNWAVLSDNGGVEEEITSLTEFGAEGIEVALYPTIIDDYFQIEGEEGLYRLSIMDVSGKVLAEFEQASVQERIDVSDLSAGTYVVQIWSLTNSLVGVKRVFKH